MSSGLYNGVSGLALGTGLYKDVSGLWSGASGLVTGFGGGFTPASLFTAGESGYWLDPSDFTTMWQDHQGVTPVTATGQTCGLILDKRIGTRTQVFDDANVTFSGSAGYAGRVSPGVYEYARDASGIGTVFFGGLTTGRTYLVSLQVSAYAGAIPGITAIRADFFSALNVGLRPFANAAGTYTFFYLADGSNFYIRAGGPGVGGTISNVSILEVPGNHFLQATAASRPLVQTDGTNNYLAFDGTDDWLQSVATINPGAVDKAQVFAGVRKLSDAVSGIVVEVSVNRTTNDGTLGVTAPVIDGYGFGLRGTQHTNVIGTSFPAPVTNVLSAQYDIAQSTAATEVVPLVNGATPTISVIGAADAGTGNFLTYTHYIGRRAGSSFPFNGRAYQMVVRYGPNLTAAQITQTETYVNDKTGAY